MAIDVKRDKLVVSAYPTKELFISMLIKDITLRDAIGDLLDNSVDGALRLRSDESYEGLRVEIELDAKEAYFKIADNCGGIPVDVARNYAFCFGRPKGSEETSYSVGLFGIGMKRALFKLGKKFRVESIAQTSSFTMEVDVEQWKEDDEEGRESDWAFQFEKFREDEKNPEDKWGTTITVTELHEDVQESFGIDNDVSELIEELQREHLYNIDKGLEIRVKGKRLEAKELELLTSDKIKTAYWESSDSPLHVKIYAGVSEEDANNTGWYIFCNKRLVVGPEKMIGWGVKQPIRIPEYHSQYYRFRGCVFLEAEKPKYLPWNTAKNGMDEDSVAYKTIFQQMVNLMRSVIDFLNKLHDEQGDYKNERINETPLQDAVEGAKPLPLHQITSDNLGQKFISPKPAERQQTAPDTVWIRYRVPVEDYDAVQKYFGVEKAGEVGSKTFNYFYTREIED
ncbi:ATP-binding protein [Candidatus Poribacteria bacterium]|nr:ATP-binding protein [Candidatus Poribacteria bacterium]